MAEFSELIKNFDKIRDYMRDFFVYGFKTREDFTQKSLRTYDNERRRIESYLSNYIKYDTASGNKSVFISMDATKISENPLYNAWKSKSFTDNDIMLHFYIVDILNQEKQLKVEELTNRICEQSNKCFDTQTVRIKANEYVKEGILVSSKQGKALLYELSQDYLYKMNKSDREDLLDAIKYYQGTAPFGVVGSYLLDNENEKNDIFSFKHNFIVHTLEDKILLELLKAIKEKKYVQFINQSSRTKNTNKLQGIPVKIFVSSQSGRRYVTIYNEWRKRFINYRLDSIKSVKVSDECEYYDSIKEDLEKNLNRCWGVSFGGTNRKEQLFLKLYIDEKNEMHILRRREREGKGGEIIRIDKNIYLYSKDTFDVNEMMPWVKTFIGRIISFECTNKFVYNKFYNDMKRMQEMYLENAEVLF